MSNFPIITYGELVPVDQAARIRELEGKLELERIRGDRWKQIATEERERREEVEQHLESATGHLG